MTFAITYRRALIYTLRNPMWVAFGLLQPILYLLLFGPLLVKLDATPGFPGHDSWQVFIPGLLVNQAVFGCAFTGYGILAERRAGVLDRLKTAPVSQLALLAGRIARDVTVLLVQGLLLTGGALLMGLRAPAGGVAIAFALIAVLGTGVSAFSYGLALRLRNEEAFSSMLNSLMLPLLLLSGVLLPMTLAPKWLSVLADVNPLSHVVSSERALFHGGLVTSVVGIGALVAVLCVAFAGVYGARAFRDTRS
jgi:ABC-2 type transport system permease protein